VLTIPAAMTMIVACSAADTASWVVAPNRRRGSLGVAGARSSR
jgi:hypothetical protein